MKKIILASIIAATSISASAENYLNTSIDFLTFKQNGVSDISNQVLNIGFGHKLNQNLAIEGSVGFGFGDDTINYKDDGDEFNIETTLKTKNILAVNLVADFPVSNKLNLMANAGYTRITAEASGRAYNDDVSITFEADSDSESAIGAGVGLQYSVANTLDVFAGLKYLGKFEQTKVNSFEFGASYKF